jgi:hypothetical protein
MDAKLKHLEFIQAIITRMNSNSFMLKGWCITLVSALFALAAKDANPLYVLVAYIPLPAFWLLDGFYLSQERQYRDLDKDASKRDPAQVDFSLDATAYRVGRNTWPAALLSRTIAVFYGIAAVTVLVVMFLIQR